MIIDLHRTVIKTYMRRFITLIVFTIIILVIILGGSLRTNYLGLTKYQWAVIVSGLYLTVAIIESMLDFNYIYFDDNEDKIIFRYFSMSFYNKKKNSIEIPNKDFRGYTLVKKFLGLKEFIILSQDYKGKEAKYPPVNITALSSKQRKELITALEKDIKYAGTLKI
jgi:hypothetical protein